MSRCGRRRRQSSFVVVVVCVNCNAHRSTRGWLQNFNLTSKSIWPANNNNEMPESTGFHTHRIQLYSTAKGVRVMTMRLTGALLAMFSAPLWHTMQQEQLRTENSWPIQPRELLLLLHLGQSLFSIVAWRQAFQLTIGSGSRNLQQDHY